MRRYWIDPQFIYSDLVTIQGDSFYHICGVCRQKQDDQFEVLGKPDTAYLVKIIEVHKNKAVAQILEARTIIKPKGPEIILNLCLPKNQTLDLIIEKAVELGVDHIQPVMNEFSFIKKSDQWSSNRLERINKIVLSATQQSGRSDLMPVLEPKKLTDVVQFWANQTPRYPGLMAYENSSPVPLKMTLSDKCPDLKKSEKIYLFVGSEGGFSMNEAQWALDQGLILVNLGSQVLRVETACISLISAIKYEVELM